MLLKVTQFNKPPVSIKPPWVKSILLNKPPGAYSIIYGIYKRSRIVGKDEFLVSKHFLCIIDIKFSRMVYQNTLDDVILSMRFKSNVRLKKARSPGNEVDFCSLRDGLK